MEESNTNKARADSLDIEHPEYQFELLPDDSTPMQSESNIPEETIAEVNKGKKMVIEDESRDQDVTKDGDNSIITEEQDLSKTRNTTSVEDKANDSKQKYISDGNENIESEDAARELAELFNSGEETAKEFKTPSKEDIQKEERIIKETESKRPKQKGKKKGFESEPHSGVKSSEEKKSSEEVKIPKKRGRKKLPHNENKSSSELKKKLDDKNKLFEVNLDHKFVIANRKLTPAEIKERYQDIIYEVKDETEACCLVCLDDESFTEDDIIICDLCNSAFHQSCYGSDLLNIAEDDDSEWHCQRCSHLFNNDLPVEAIKCSFCPEFKGPMKKIRESSTNEWGHIVCVNWIPEIYYQDDPQRTNVIITEYKSRNHCGRKSLICSFCKIRYGDSIQCDTEKCTSAFHVTCAQRHGLICNWKEMHDLKRDEDTEFYLPIYCKKHMKAYSQAMFDFSNHVEERNKARASSVSHLYDPSAPSKTYSTPKRGRKTASTVNSRSGSSKRLSGIHISPFDDGLGIVTKKESLEKPSAELDQSDRLHGRKSKKGKQDSEGEVTYKVVETNEELDLKPQKSEFNRASSNDMDEEKSKENDSDEVIDSSFLRVPDTIKTKKEHPRPPSRSRKQVLGEEQNFVDEEKPVVPKRKHRKKQEKPEKQVKQEKQEKQEKHDKHEKQEKQEKIEVKKSTDKPAKSSKVDPHEKEKRESSGALYKFRPNMAKLIKFNGWGTEKEVKKVISDYIKAKNLYRKDREELDISRDPELEEILGLGRIPRKQIFVEFMHFMLKKSPEDVVREDNDLPFFSSYEEEYNKFKEKKSQEKISKRAGEDEDSNSKGWKIKRKNTPSNSHHPPLPSNFKKVSSQKTHTIDLIKYNGLHSNAGEEHHKDPREDVGIDFLNWKPRSKVSETHTIAMQNTTNLEKLKSSQDLSKSNNLEEIQDQPIKKIKANPPNPPLPKGNSPSIFHTIFGDNNRYVLNSSPEKTRGAYEGLAPIIKGADRMPFRKTMNWLMKTDTSLMVPSINSPAALEKFWPKGAEILF